MARAWCPDCKRFVNATKPLPRRRLGELPIYCPICQSPTVALSRLKEIDKGERRAGEPKGRKEKLIFGIADMLVASGVAKKEGQPLDIRVYKTWVEAGKPE